MPLWPANSLVIVEVLSKSTEGYDRGVKFEMYRQIASFREYLLVAQDRVYVEHRAREESHRKVWVMRECTSLEEVMHLKTINVQLRLPDLYAKVSFPVADW